MTKPIYVCSIMSLFFAAICVDTVLVHIRAAETPKETAPPATITAPSVPQATSLEISEAWSDLQAAYIALQNTPQQKAFLDAQAVYNGLVQKAQVAQGIPPNCIPKKGQWLQQSGANFSPCQMPAPPAKEKEKK